MNKFKGTTLECINELVKNGWKGTVVNEFGYKYLVQEDHGLFSLMIKKLNDYGYPSYVIFDSELERQATYLPPEPIWKLATPGEALDAYSTGKNVEFRLSDDAPVDAYRVWAKVTALYLAWSDPFREYRIEVPA